MYFCTRHRYLLLRKLLVVSSFGHTSTHNTAITFHFTQSLADLCLVSSSLRQGLKVQYHTPAAQMIHNLGLT